jgi:hypothetical protein
MSKFTHCVITPRIATAKPQNSSPAQAYCRPHSAWNALEIPAMDWTECSGPARSTPREGRLSQADEGAQLRLRR